MRRLVLIVTAAALAGAALIAAGPQGSAAPARKPAQAAPAAKPPAQTQTPAGAARAAPKLAGSHPETTGLAIEAKNKLVAQYCVTCHNDRGKDRAGSLTLSSFDASKVVQSADVAEKMIRKLRSGMMPPPGARRPDAETIKAFYTTLERKIDTAAALNPNPGWRPFQRLNRAEYAAGVRDLLSIDVDVNAFLPPDPISGGFDKIADAQKVSPALVEGDRRPANQIRPPAAADPNAPP